MQIQFTSFDACPKHSITAILYASILKPNLNRHLHSSKRVMKFFILCMSCFKRSTPVGNRIRLLRFERSFQAPFRSLRHLRMQLDQGAQAGEVTPPTSASEAGPTFPALAPSSTPAAPPSCPSRSTARYQLRTAQRTSSPPGQGFIYPGAHSAQRMTDRDEVIQLHADEQVLGVAVTPSHRPRNLRSPRPGS